MAAASVNNSNPQAQPESPSEKLKQNHTSTPSVSSKLNGATANGVDNIDSPYFRELQRFVISKWSSAHSHFDTELTGRL